MTLATLTDGRRAIFYGAFGMIALLIAGQDKLFSSGFGTLLWIVLLAASVAATEQPFVQGVFDYETPLMANGRLVLIGDAAFEDLADGAASQCFGSYVAGRPRRGGGRGRP